MLKRAIREADGYVRKIIVDAEPIDLVDATNCDTLIKLQSELAGKGIVLAFARLRDPLRDMMRRAGVEAAFGPENFYDRINEGVKAFTKEESHNDASGK